MLYIIAVVLLVVGALSAVASRRDLGAMQEYRERVQREVPNAEGWAKFPAAQRRLAQRQIKRGQAVTNPEIAAAMLGQYDALGAPPDFTRLSGLIGDVGLAIIFGLLALSGMRIVAIAAFVALLVMLSLTARKWQLRRAIERSVVATRRMHQTA
jgi:hypothetical protein